MGSTGQRLERKRKQPVRGLAQTAPEQAEQAQQDATSETERIIRLQQQKIAALETQLGEMRKLLQEMIEEKERARQGMLAVQEQLAATHEAKPLSPQERQQLFQVAVDTAAEQHEQKRSRFMEVVNNSPRVVINNFYPEPVLLTVNGVSVLLPPGAHEVPSPFLTAWEAFVESNREAQEREMMIRGEQDSGTLDRWLLAGRYMPSPAVIPR